MAEIRSQFVFEPGMTVKFIYRKYGHAPKEGDRYVKTRVQGSGVVVSVHDDGLEVETAPGVVDSIPINNHAQAKHSYVQPLGYQIHADS